MDSFELMLLHHASRVKDSMVSPFNSEMEDIMNTNRTKRRSVSRIVFIAVAAALLLGTTAFAAGVARGGWFSTTAKEYDDIPTIEEVAEDIGYEPVIIEQFSNGFTWMNGQAIDNQVIGTDMEIEDTFKSSLFEYSKDGQIVYFSQEKSEVPVGSFGELFGNYKGIDFYYYSYINTVVPEDYELSEAEIEARDKGEVVFTFGSDSIFTMEVKSLSWCKDGVNYMLMQTGGNLTAADLMEMAKEAVDK